MYLVYKDSTSRVRKQVFVCFRAVILNILHCFRMISACYAIDHALRAPKKASTRATIYRDFGSNPVVALCWTIETNTSRSVLMVACRPPKVKNKMTHTTAQAAPHA